MNVDAGPRSLAPRAVTRLPTIGTRAEHPECVPPPSVKSPALLRLGLDRSRPVASGEFKSVKIGDRHLITRQARLTTGPPRRA
jgi:hypothetical protein